MISHKRIKKWTLIRRKFVNAIIVVDSNNNNSWDLRITKHGKLTGSVLHHYYPLARRWDKGVPKYIQKEVVAMLNKEPTK